MGPFASPMLSITRSVMARLVEADPRALASILSTRSGASRWPVSWLSIRVVMIVSPLMEMVMWPGRGRAPSLTIIVVVDESGINRILVNLLLFILEQTEWHSWT